MKTKIYISGKISEIEEEAKRLFEAAELKLNNLGYETINPMKLNHQHDLSWHSYMKVDIKALCDCDEIYMLSNWAQSPGAKIEHQLAIQLMIKRTYE